MPSLIVTSDKDRVCQCPLLAISGHTEGCSKGSALLPRADITGEKLHPFLKADINDCPSLVRF